MLKITSIEIIHKYTQLYATIIEFINIFKRFSGLIKGILFINYQKLFIIINIL